MSPSRRIVLLVGVAGLGLVGSGLAQEGPEPRNWPAAPYWTPPTAQGETPGSPGAARRGLVPGEEATLTATPLPFVALAPCRIIDTRSGSGFPSGYGPPSLPSGTQRSFTATGNCGIPADAQAVSFNFTVWAPVTRGDIRVFPAGGGTPTVSTLNWEANILALANAAVVPLGTGGAITVQVDGAGTIDLIVDVNGYYSPQGVVNSVNGLAGAVTLSAGTNVTITPSGQTLTISAAGGGGGGGGTVTSVGTGAGLTGGPITTAGTVSVQALGITTGMLADGAVTGAKLASGSVGLSKIDASQVQARVTTSCPPGTTIQSIAADGTAFCVATPSQTALSISTIDTGLVGGFTSIKIGRDGLGLISYFDEGNGRLKAAHCSNAACTSATASVLDSAGLVGEFSSLAIGADGLGLISYYDRTNADLKVAHCSDAACTSASTATLDSAGNVGMYTSIAIGTDGLGLITYFDSVNWDLKVAHCANTACTSATITTIEGLASVGSYSSVAIGSDGLGLISYFDGGTLDLKTAHCLNVACTSASTATLDSAGTVGVSTSLAIGGDGLGLISYRDETNQDLKVAHCANVACTSVAMTTVEGAGNVGYFNAIAIGPDGLGLIAYHDSTNGRLKLARCATADCMTSTITVVDSAPNVGWYPSIAIGPDGLGLVSYNDRNIGALKVARLGSGLSSLNSLTGPVTIAGAGGTTVTQSGGTLTITSPAVPAAWNLSGNAGTTPGTNFLGTTDGQALEVKVNGARALRIEPTTLVPNLIGGLSINYASSGVQGATIGGGGAIVSATSYPNRVTDDYGTVGGGTNNVAGNETGTTSDSPFATVGGGADNYAGGDRSTVAGGGQNIAVGPSSAVGGGYWNNAAGSWATVPGGAYNIAGGDWSFAGGQRARVRLWWQVGGGNTTGDKGTFVWADSQAADFVSTGNDQFLVRAQGGVGINTNDPQGFTLAVNGTAAKPGGGSWSTYSDARLKRDVRPLEGALDRLLALRGVSFEYTDPAAIHELPGTRIGMVAQDVETVFSDWVSEGPDGYKRLTYRGFEAIAVEALRDLRTEKDSEIAALKSALAAIRARLEEIEARLSEPR